MNVYHLYIVGSLVGVLIAALIGKMILGTMAGGSVTGGGGHVGARVFVGFAVTGALEGLAVLGRFVGQNTGESVGQP